MSALHARTVDETVVVDKYLSKHYEILHRTRMPQLYRARAEEERALLTSELSSMKSSLRSIVSPSPNKSNR